MPRTGWTPSIVPNGDDQNVYLVVDDFGRNGRAYRETDVETADLETVIVDLLEGQYKNPIRVVAFNTAEKWSQDVSADVAHELRCAAISNCATFRSSCKISLTATRAVTRITSCPCPSAWSDHGVSPAKATCRWHQGP